MPGKPLLRLLGRGGKEPVEDSIPLRVAVWLCVIISVLSLQREGVISAGFALGASILISGGYVYSYLRRNSPGTILKAFIVVLLLWALADFLRKVYRDPLETRVPLAELFMWVQILHGFHLPRRKDLLYSLVSSLVLLSLAGSYSTGFSFLWSALPWFVSSTVALYLFQFSRFSQVSGGRMASSPSAIRLVPIKLFALMLLSVFLIGLAVGSFIPRLPPGLLRPLPFSLVRPYHPSRGFRWINPGYPDLPLKPPDRPVDFNPEAYFGFAPYLDLRLRGKPVDVPVMRVRSSSPAYWRGVAFRDYRHTHWTCEEDERPLRTEEQPFWLSWDPREAHNWTERVVQTFYVQADEANVVFAAFRPSLVYFPSDTIFASSSGIKSPYPLSEGIVYSVVSEVARPIVNGHRGDRRGSPAEALRPYLELPEMPERVVRLAESLAAGSEPGYQTALKIVEFLESNYDYSLDIPPLEEGEDAVDKFLFVDRKGFCEQFASAFVVLCRLAGIPARVVTGYATGEYNPFTGLYEVKRSDAHAWAEIYLEGNGWIAVDPTPGMTPPEPRPWMGPRFIFRDLFAWMGTRLSSLFPTPLKRVLAWAARSLGRFPYNLIALPVFMAISLILILKKRARALFRSEGRSTATEGIPNRSIALFLSAMSLLGLQRSPHLTFREYLLGLPSSSPLKRRMEAATLFERLRYGHAPPGSSDLPGLRRALLSILATSARDRLASLPGRTAALLGDSIRSFTKRG